MLELNIIHLEDYPCERESIFKLVDAIWHGKDARQARHSIERWGTSKIETGTYFYILQDARRIGITGYFIPNRQEGMFGLRHHGTSVKGTGRHALDLLVGYLKAHYGDDFKCLIELVPKGRTDLIRKFEEWGFHLDPQGVPKWEPKKGYYGHAMIRKE